MVVLNLVPPPPRIQNHTLLTSFPSPALFILWWGEESWRHNEQRSWVKIRIIHWKQQWEKKLNSNNININNKIVQKQECRSPSWPQPFHSSRSLRDQHYPTAASVTFVPLEKHDPLSKWGLLFPAPGNDVMWYWITQCLGHAQDLLIWARTRTSH